MYIHACGVNYWGFNKSIQNVNLSLEKLFEYISKWKGAIEIDSIIINVLDEGKTTRFLTFFF